MIIRTGQYGGWRAWVPALALGAMATLAARAQIVLRDPPRRGSGAPEQVQDWSAVARAGATEGRVLVTKDLKRIQANDPSFEGSTVRYRDGLGRPSAAQLSDVLAVLPGEARGLGVRREIEWRELGDPDSTPSGRLELVDGQVLPGRPDKGAHDAERLGWRHARIGALDIPLDLVRRLVLRPAGAETVAPERDDVIVLTNGDKLRGVVEEVRFGSGEIQVSVGSTRSVVALDRVVQIVFSNPSKPAAGARLWLRDRTVIAACALVFKDGDLECAPLLGGPAQKIPLGEISACALVPERLVPLASLTPTSVQAREGRVWTAPPVVQDAATAPLGAADIELPGPMSVSWELPGKASAVGFSAELPPAARALGACALVAQVDGVEAARERLSADHPRATMIVPTGSAAPARLTLLIESGERGPIQNRVLLRGAVVLVNP